MAFHTQPSIPINNTFLGLAAKALFASDCSSEIRFSSGVTVPAFLHELINKMDRKNRNDKNFNVFIVE